MKNTTNTKRPSKADLRAVMAALGRTRSTAKAKAARKNGKQGGRPLLRFGVIEDTDGWHVVDRTKGNARCSVWGSYHGARGEARRMNGNAK